MMSEIMRLHNVSKEYVRGGLPFLAVKDVNLTIESGDFVNIIGRSGSGKSTLINMAAGMLTPTSGSVELFGEFLGGKDDEYLSRLRNDKIGFIPQGMSLLPNLTVLENVVLPFFMYPHGGDGEGYGKIMLDRMEILNLADAYPEELSGGEKRRAVIARAMVNRPEIVIADEPTSDLDVISAQNIMKIFAELNNDGLTLLIVSHDLESIKYGRRVFTMENGTLTEGRHI